MNKQEAIETIEQDKIVLGKVAETSSGVNTFQRKIESTYYVPLGTVVSAITKINEQQKPVVPKFVAEWLDKHKNGKKKYRLSHALEHVFDDTELGLYIKQQEGDYTETMARAWLDGYEIEQEKLYTVEIPNPNNEYSMNALIRLPSSGKIALVALHKPNTSYLKNKEYQLTEAEIKQDFEWAWQWAKEVE